MSNKLSFKEHYYIYIPILLTILLYGISVTYDFRNFDEDILIKNFYVHKTFHEYIEKYLLIHFKGVTEAHGFTFSGIRNTHVSILGIPAFYMISFLFHGKAFLFHAWSLLLHCLALYFFIRFCFNMTSNKNIALFSGLLWTLHPTNVEPIIWATNWAHSLGAALYFYTLKKITELDLKKEPSKNNILFILLVTLVQILFTEHTITIPFAIFLTAFFIYAKSDLEKSFKTALRISFPSFAVIGIYWLLRNLLISKTISHASQNSFSESINRIIYLTPQVFLHQLKLIFFPIHLTIDQIDLIKLDNSLGGSYHLFSLVVFLAFILLAFISWKDYKSLSLGLFLYLITVGPFIQIIPLYSISAERYNYFGSAFLLFGIISTLFKLFENKKRLIVFILLIFCLCFGIRSFTRITEWRNSKTLFLSTANTSKSLLKKGIWIYNLAICPGNEKKKEELLKLSINLLDLFIQNEDSSNQQFLLLKKYELDKNSLKAKAAHRIATNYELLNDRENTLKYLFKALDFAQPDSQTQALIFKNLGTFYFQDNSFTKSLEYYLKSNSISPNPSIDYAISICYLKMNDSINYEQYLQKAASVISPYNMSPFKTYGQFLETSKNDIPSAVRFYKIASLVEDNVEPYILLTTAQLKLRQIEEAYKSVRKGLYGFPNNPSLIYFDGVIKINKGKPDEGIKDLIKVADMEDTPRDIKVEACHILVNIFLNKKERDKALKYNELILSIDKTDSEALKQATSLPASPAKRGERAKQSEAWQSQKR